MSRAWDEWEAHRYEITMSVETANENMAHGPEIRIAGCQNPFLKMPMVYAENDNCHVLYPVDNEKWMTGTAHSLNSLLESGETWHNDDHASFNEAFEAFLANAGCNMRFSDDANVYEPK